MSEIYDALEKMRDSLLDSEIEFSKLGHNTRALDAVLEAVERALAEIDSERSKRRRSVIAKIEEALTTIKRGLTR